MAKFDFLTYMRALAETLVELQHTEADRHFHRIDTISGLEEFIAQANFVNGYQLLAMDRFNVALDDSAASDNLIDRTYFSFLVIKSAVLNDFDDTELVKSTCKTIVEKILSKMFYDKRNAANGLYNLNRSSVYYDPVGPMGQNYYGYMCSFVVLDASDIKYNALDWIN